ncbi:phosphoserine phosphatase SerB [Sphingosinicella sp. CPCC 101087]|uniref:phosphoserine phosphatase SerB n=1 Tax=Sphingosinicella sp. CPCC 101087 TaxID=2497754 RepID=UPI00101C6F9F|nr:phosphoserine phosphatase SerB [Sphingosinicella sp. CPCC 101087]
MFIATLIAADRLGRGDISAASDALRAAGVATSAPLWIEEGSACDLPFSGEVGAARAALERRFDGIDIVVQAIASRTRKLLAADMDSTMITVECIDELADFAGVKAEVAAVTEQAMRGELDFEAALDARVRLLRGLDEAAIDRCREERVTLMPGARTLVRTMRARGAFCLLVSGGFTRFAEPVAEAIGFDSVAANRLDIDGGKLTGTVGKPVFGAQGKLEAMLEAAARLGIDRNEILAVGDGANDIPMLEAAGLGVAYHAKPAVAAAADARIAANDLTALLYLQGIPRAAWVE